MSNQMGPPPGTPPPGMVNPAQPGLMPQMPGAAPPVPAAPPGAVKVYDLTKGKYDLAVEAGPSYTTRREEAVDMITQFISAAPMTAPILGPMLAKMSDWPEAEKVSELLATMMPPEAKAIFTGQPMPPPGPPPEVQAQMMKTQAEIQAMQMKAQADAQIQAQKAHDQQQREQTQAMADMATMQRKAQLEEDLAARRDAREDARDQRRFEMEMALEVQKAHTQQAIKIHETKLATIQSLAASKRKPAPRKPKNG